MRVLLLAVITLLALASATYAQVTTATLVGLVRDTSGAVIPGATVVTTNEGTGVSRNTITNADGEFVLTALPNGSYSLQIELAGFKTLTSRGLVLGSGQAVKQTFTLEVGMSQ